MTSNNLEAIKRLNEFKKYWYSKTPAAQKDLDSVIDLLQADEDIEVKEHACLCKEDNCPNCELIGCKHKKPTKETKLQDLKTRINEGNIKSWRLALNMLIDALEEEY